MLKFFFNIKFWMPILLLMVLALILEIFLRFGYWDSYIKPQSYLGNAVYREKAVKEFGLLNIHWITIGDSKTDWGIEHNQIFSIQKEKGLNHLRMSFESSNFMAIQATIDWSIANMPNLKGIIIGVSTDNFSHFSNVATQYKVAWPFRKYFDYNKFKYFNEQQNLFAYLSRNATSVFFKDLKSFFGDFQKRFFEIEKYSNNSHNKIFQFNRSMKGNICQFQLENLKRCVQTAEELISQNKLMSGAENFIINVCSTAHAKYLAENNLKNYSLESKIKSDFTNNWQKLFESILDRNLKLKLVFLPEHPLFDYVINPANSHEIVEYILGNLANKNSFELLDLRNIFNINDNHLECEYFQDPLHFNNLGKKLITNKVIESFPMSPKQNTDSKDDKINKSDFELMN